MTLRNYLHVDANSNAINVVILDDQIPVPDFLTGNGETLIADYDGPWAPGAHYNGSIVEMPPEPEVAIIRRVTAAQAKLALYNAGLLDEVVTAVAAYPPMKIFFDNSPYWDINHPYVQGLAAELGLNNAMLDALFVSAAGL